MQKHRSIGSKSFRQSSERTELYRPITPLVSAEDAPKTPLESAEEVKQWEEARCPICMEHPHNAVLLRCTSYDKGCRPYMCNTSYRHSNCLDQFCKSSVSSPSTLTIQGNLSARSNLNRTAQSNAYGSESQHKLSCPMCRGEIFGWFVVEAARNFMNSKVRSCSTETCDFSGNYLELRQHARSDHPAVRPSEVDPERQHDWTRLQRESEFSDMMSMIRAMTGLGGGEEGDQTRLEYESDYLGMFSLFRAMNGEGEIELELHTPADSLQSLHSSIISIVEVIQSTMAAMSGLHYALENLRINRQNNSLGWSNNYRQGNFGRSNSSIQNNTGGQISNGFRSNFRDRSNYRQRNYNNSLNSRENYSRRGNLTERMRSNRTNNIRRGWDQQRYNLRRDRWNQQRWTGQ